MSSLADFIPFVLSLLPLVLRGITNFGKEEKNISNNRKSLLDQIRIGLSVEFSKNVQFDDDIIQIDEDTRSKLRESMNDFLYVNTSNLLDFNQANRNSKLAINWIRTLKYSLVIGTILSFALYVLIIVSIIDVAENQWYFYFLGVGLAIAFIWILKERTIDVFNNLCVKYEVERND